MNWLSVNTVIGWFFQLGEAIALYKGTEVTKSHHFGYNGEILLDIVE